MTMPQTIPPIVCMILCATVMMILALRHVTLDLVDHRLHHAQHAAIEPQCPDGTRITIIEDGKKTCLIEHIKGHGMADRRQYVAAK